MFTSKANLLNVRLYISQAVCRFCHKEYSYLSTTNIKVFDFIHFICIYLMTLNVNIFSLTYFVRLWFVRDLLIIKVVILVFIVTILYPELDIKIWNIIANSFSWIISISILKLEFNINKDDNIDKLEALKRYDRRTLTLVECQNWICKI